MFYCDCVVTLVSLRWFTVALQRISLFRRQRLSLFTPDSAVFARYRNVCVYHSPQTQGDGQQTPAPGDEMGIKARCVAGDCTAISVTENTISLVRVCRTNISKYGDTETNASH